jgi:hypothetical protein
MFIRFSYLTGFPFRHLFAKWGPISMILVLGLTMGSLSRGALIEDDFEGDTVDLSKWQLINGPDVDIIQSGGQLFFYRPVLQLNYLATVEQIDPAVNPLTITGSVTLATNGDMDVWTRANIVANTSGSATHVLDSGIRINFWQDAVDSGYPPNLDILEKTAGVWPWDSTISDGANIPGDDEAVDWDFVITDDGTTISATFTQTSDPTNTLTLTGTSTTDFATDYVAFTVTSGYLNDVTILGGETYPYASQPDPPDRSASPNKWVTLSWKASGLAVSHDVYFGDNFDDVNDGTGDTFRGNFDLDTTFYIAGFPGYAYPDGLVNGTTYYWRIDEVNDANPNSPWKGNVWSFIVPPKKAYGPFPVDSSRFIDPDVTLTWKAGFGAKSHTVYFGDDYDTVANATSGKSSTAIGYTPETLEPHKTYYWRVDENDGTTTYKGDTWSFTTAKEGGGVRADYYRGMNFENHVLTRIDPQINFNWGNPGSPDPAVGDDNFSARWTGEVEAAFTETYTFYATGDDGIRLWINGQQLVNAWVDQGATEYLGTIDLVAGNTYSLIMEYYENTGDTRAELSWSSASTPKQVVPQAALSPPIKASSPNPSNGATGTKLSLILQWIAGDYATSHELYFGTDADAVANATNVSPEYKGTIALGDESYDPGKLAWFTTYYWRIDEVNAVNPDSPWVGNLWSFTTGDFLLIDDFEDYDAGENQIWYAWHDGLGYGEPGTDLYYPGNGTGAAVGDETTASYTEETIVHGGHKSMPLAYDNNKEGYSKYSEVELTLTAPRDWTDEDVAELSIWFRGYRASTGSFAEGPTGIYTITASGADIWLVNGVEADEFHFAYKMLNGAGSITAKVNSVDNTNDWAKAGVMIRESLNPNSAHAMMVVTPGSGVSFQRRGGTGETSTDTTTAGITAPYWVKIERDLAGNYTGYSSANGTTWTQVGTDNFPMGTNTYIGLAVTAHDPALTCQAVFSNITFTGNVTGQWADQDIGILSNDAEPLYVAVSNSNGTSAIVVHDDPAAAQIDTWTEWVIPLSAFADQGINLTDVDSIALGLGTRGNTTVAGGSGKMFFDDIRLYRTREAAGE